MVRTLWGMSQAVHPSCCLSFHCLLCSEMCWNIGLAHICDTPLAFRVLLVSLIHLWHSHLHLFLCHQLQRSTHHWGERPNILYHPPSLFPSHGHWRLSWGTHPIPSWMCCEFHSWEVPICGDLGLTGRRPTCRPPWTISLRSLSIDLFSRLEVLLLRI